MISYAGFAQASPQIEHGFGTKQTDNTSFLATPARSMVRLQQVHGAKVVRVGAGFDADALLHSGHDAAVTDEPNMVLIIRTADCLPVLFHHAKTHTIAAAHAGWRGLAKGVLQNTLSELCPSSAELDSVRVAIGPGIGPDHFNVGEDVYGAFSNQFGGRLTGAFRASCAGQFACDLYQIASRILREVGIREENIFVQPRCTYCESETFFSYRQSAGQEVGRNLSGIVLHAANF